MRPLGPPSQSFLESVDPLIRATATQVVVRERPDIYLQWRARPTDPAPPPCAPTRHIGDPPLLTRRLFARGMFTAAAAPAAIVATAPAAAAAGEGVTFEGRRDVTSYGVTGNGTTDDRAAIQSAIDSGAPLIFPAGTYRCRNSLRLDAGSDLYLAPGARLVKDFANAGGNSGAFIANRVLATKVNDARIHGPGRISAHNAAATGVILALNGDRILLQDFTVDQWNGGRVVTMAGDYNRIVNVKCYGSPAATNNGGIRVLGGRQFIAYGCHVESGDDSFQFVPSPPGGDAMSGLGIYDSVYIGCTGRSTNAKFMVIALQQEIPDGVVLPAWTQGVYNSGFIGCNGYGGIAALVVQNAASAAPIENCYVTDCNVDMALGLNTGTDADINAWASTGGITGLHLNGLRIRNPRNVSLTLSRTARDTTIENSAFSRGSQSPTSAVVRLGGFNTKFLNNRVDGGNVVKAAVTVEAPLSGGGSNPSRVLVRGNHIYNLGAGAASYGVDVFAGDRVTLRENFFEQASGVTGAKGFRFQAGVTNAKAIDNDTAALTSTTKFTNAATGAVIGDTQVA